VIQGSGATASYAPTTGTTTGLSAVLTVTAPDGITITTPTVTTTPAVTPTSFTATVPATQVGAYLLVWTVTGGTTTDIGKDQFSVVAPSLDLLSLTDLKDQINVAATDVSGNEKLRRYLISATDVVENITGPLRGQTRTEYFDGNRSTVVLLPRWVSAITS